MILYPVAELAGGCAGVPAAPGVYVFLGAEKSALYVGKSINLRARLASYFRPGAAAKGKIRALRQFGRWVRIECTGSEFAALLREVELVQTLAPSYNRRLRHPERYEYIGVDYRHPFPRLVVTRELWEGGQFLGPFPRSRRTVEAVQAVADAFGLRCCDPMADGNACWRYQVRLCSAPCLGATAPGTYGRELLHALVALTGPSRVVVRALAAERDRLAGLERFEEAARRQRRIEAIERLRGLLYISQRVWHDALVVQPAAEPGSVSLWGIVGGAVRVRAVGARGRLGEAFGEVWAALQESTSPASAIPQRELDGRWIVHRWLLTPAGKQWSVAFRGRGRDAVWHQVVGLADQAVAELFTAVQDHS